MARDAQQICCATVLLGYLKKVRVKKLQSLLGLHGTLEGEEKDACGAPCEQGHQANCQYAFTNTFNT
jgi:hypothetical protein